MTLAIDWAFVIDLNPKNALVKFRRDSQLRDVNTMIM
jgi:hypothetical protein